MGHRGDLVVVGGLPGAGKSTWLRTLADEPALLVLDPEQLTHRLRRVLPTVPYRALRPVVHAGHWVRVGVAAVASRRTVVVHETATRAVTRAALLALARAGRRPARLVWLDVAPDEALAGQRARGRVLASRSFARHLRRTAATPPERLRGWADVRRVRREAVDGLERVA